MTISTRGNGQTDRQTNIVTYGAAIAAKNVQTTIASANYHVVIFS